MTKQWAAQYSRRMKNLLQRLQLALPATCAICAAWPARPVCAQCLERYATTKPRCPTCALALAPGLTRCTRCSSTENHFLQHCITAVDYAHPWSAVVTQLKQDPAWAQPLAHLLSQNTDLHKRLQHTDLMVPIPLSAIKIRQRGYNQAWELTKALSQCLPQTPPAAPDILQRHTHGAVQHELDRAQRLQNAEEAYTVAATKHRQLRGRRLLLIDDVMTTGATLQAAAKVLLTHGALEVSALVFARTPAPSLD
jgi:ComF family protein